MTEPERDYYEVLGVPRDADAATIKSRYRHLAQKHHPDRSSAPDAEEKFKEIAKAYAVLHDPKKRAAYDAHGHAGIAHFSHEDLFGGFDFGGLFGDRGFGDSFFSRMFGHRQSEPGRGPDVHTVLTIPLERIDSGGEEIVSFSVMKQCGECDGSGAAAGTKPRDCGQCGGKGEIIHTRTESGVRFQQITTCPACRGQGQLIDKPCSSCRGDGKVSHESKVKLTVPAGAPEGLVLRVPAHGAAGATPDVPPGDLLVTVRSRADPRFERRGDDLWHGTTLSVPDAVLGAKVRVPTLSGDARLTVPPGTQPGTVMRLEGKGVTRYSRSMRGDMLIVVQVRLPSTLSREQRRTYERLRDLDVTPSTSTAKASDAPTPE